MGLNLNVLSKKEKEELLRLLEEKERFRVVPKLEVFRKPARYKIAEGGRGGGKSESVATLLLEAGYYNKERVLCTREIQDSIKESVYQLLKEKIEEIRLSNFYVVKKDTIVGKNGTQFIFSGVHRNIEKIKSFKGITKCWVEEAQAISDESLRLLIPTIREKDSELWFTYNRRTELDPVHNLVVNKRPGTIAVNINYWDNPWFPEVLRQEMLFDKEDDYELYLHTWEGQPRAISEYAILKNSEVSSAMSRVVDDTGEIQIGADIARFGNDRTVLFKRKGLKAMDYKIIRKKDNVEVADLIIDFADSNKKTFIKVDDTGVGGGVTDILMHKGFNVMPINFGGEPKDKDKYTNVISQMWFEFKDLIRQLSLPKLEDLRAELITREWEMDSKGRRCVESKEKYKKKGYKSPDLADACLLCFYTPHNSFEAIERLI